MLKTSRRQLAAAIVRLLREQPDRRSETLRAVAAYLIERRQVNQLELLVKDITHELRQAEGLLWAEVRTAFPLSDASRRVLKEHLKKVTGAKTIELEETLEPQLLSGVIVRTADEELDTTARRALRQLASLNSGGKN